MKFWKTLSYLILQTLPDWRDKFLSYKSLKKQLKLIYPHDHHHHTSRRPTKRRRLSSPVLDVENKQDFGEFQRLLEDEIDKFNSFFVDKEEEYIIRSKELQDRLAEARHSNEELMRVEREIVDFHGEMVLLENYSALNYTGLVKILKKYDKRSGTLIRLPFIQKVLQEPFYNNETLIKLVKECEATLDRLFSESKPLASASASASSEVRSTLTVTGITTGCNNKETLFSANKELAEIENLESMYTKLTLYALRALKEIRGGSSTVNAFSLPPLEISPLEEEAWKKISCIEQVVK